VASAPPPVAKVPAPPAAPVKQQQAPAEPQAAASSEDRDADKAILVPDCTPACAKLDSIKCDGQKLELDELGRLELSPGEHECVFARRGYTSAKRQIKLKPGERAAVTVKLAKRRAVSRRPCGTFINPCP
jgi:hypothetical protein